MKTLKTLFLAFAIIASYTINAQVSVTTKMMGADRMTVVNYIDLLEKVFVIFRLNP